jgi:shikimate dehydrogenase
MNDLDLQDYEPLANVGSRETPAAFAVFGHPIAHSLSPTIHARFGEQTGIALDYRAIDVSPERFSHTLAEFAGGGGRGANVTLPHKRAVFYLCADLSQSAQRCEAVNTLVAIGDRRWRGENTDGAGLVRDLCDRHGADLRGRRALLLGAGGAARAVAYALLDAGVAELTICNRSPDAADQLADRIGDPERAHSRYWQDLAQLGSYELIVNATAAGHSGASLGLPFALAARRTLCYDLSYGKAALGFLAWARTAKADYALDGLGMLVEQAAEAFELWHGVRPETDPVYAELRERIPGDAAD